MNAGAATGGPSGGQPGPEAAWRGPGLLPQDRPTAPARVLHLVEPVTGGEGALLACVAASEIPGIDHETWVIGPPRWLEAAQRLGLPDAVGIPMSLGVPETALRSLWRVRQERLARWGRGPDAVIAYSPAAVSIATRAFALSRGLPIIGVMAVGPESAGRGWLASRRLSRCLHRATIVPLGQSLQRSWGGALGLGVTGITPPVHQPPRSPLNRAETRRILGIAPGEVVVLLLADQVDAPGARRMVQIVSMACLAGASVVGLVPGVLPDWPVASRFLRFQGGRTEIITFDGPVAGALPAADIAVWDIPRGPISRSPSPLLALAAGAAGIPVIAPDLPASREVISGGSTLTLAKGAGEQDLCRALMPMALDGGLRAGIGADLATRLGERGRRYRFHEELLDTLRVVSLGARATQAWFPGHHAASA